MSNTKKDEAIANQINVLQSTTQIHRCPGCGKMLALQNRIVLKNTFVINSTSDSQLEVSHNNASEAQINPRFVEWNILCGFEIRNVGSGADFREDV